MIPSKIDVKFECKRCGDCCKRDWDLKIDSETITEWIREKRNDLLYHVVFHPRFLLHPEYSNYEPILIIDNGHLLFGDYRKHVCPFLVQTSDGKTSCRIHNAKPLICHEFPFETSIDGKNHVRTDALNLCRGVRDYFERCAKIAGKSLDEYMQIIPKVEGEPEHVPIPRELAEMLVQRYEALPEEEKTSGLLFPELRDKRYADRVFKRAARMFKQLNLKVRITSNKGMLILDAYIHGDIDRMTQIIDTIKAPAEAIMKRYSENERWGRDLNP